MSSLDLAEDGLLGLVTMTGPAHGWAIELRSLLRIEPLSAWKGGPPLDLHRVFGVPGERGEGDGRVLVIDAGSEELPVTATGKVAVRSVAWDTVHALPPWVIGSARARFLTGIIFAEEGCGALVIVDVLGLVTALGNPSPTKARKETNA